jgi:hypothetical protein
MKFVWRNHYRLICACCASARISAPLASAVAFPQPPPGSSRMLHNLRIHQKFIAILLLPLVVLTVLAVGRIRSNVTESVRAGRVTRW